jgi:hypothetical protein
VDAPPQPGTHRGRQKRRWRDLSTRQQVAIVLLGIVQLTLAGAAWRDLARRAPEDLRGPKWFWAAFIACNWVGPISYFSVGRARPTTSSPA